MTDRTDIPAAFVERIMADRPEDGPDLLSSMETSGLTSIRLHPLKPAPIDRSDPVAWCTDGFYLSERPRFSQDPFWHAGSYYVQEASSMFLHIAFTAMMLPKDPLVLDACAAPGGRSTHLLSLLGGNGLLCSNEIIPKRNNILRENLTRWGYANAVATQDSLDRFRPFRSTFDVVLADAPCSGEGLFRREAAARRDWSPAHVSSCALRQSKLLDELVPLIRPGGYLIYSTCTFAYSENEDQVKQLIQSHGFEEVSLEGL